MSQTFIFFVPCSGKITEWEVQPEQYSRPHFLHPCWNEIQKKKTRLREYVIFRIMCSLCTPRPIYQSIYRLTLDRCIGWHIGRVSVDMSTDISADTQPISWPRYVGRHIDWCINRDIDRVMVDRSTNYQEISWSI